MHTNEWPESRLHAVAQCMPGTWVMVLWKQAYGQKNKGMGCVPQWRHYVLRIGGAMEKYWGPYNGGLGPLPKLLGGPCPLASPIAPVPAIVPCHQYFFHFARSNSHFAEGSLPPTDWMISRHFGRMKMNVLEHGQGSRMRQNIRSTSFGLAQCRTAWNRCRLQTPSNIYSPYVTIDI